MIKYRQEIENKNGWTDWIRPKMRNYKLCCCDCGLIHKMQFRIIGIHVEFRASRDNRATGQRRRRLKS